MLSPNTKVTLVDGSVVTFLRPVFADKFITTTGKLFNVKDIAGFQDSDIVLK